MKPRANWIIQPIINILSSFTHPHAVPSLYDFLCSEERKLRCLEECAGNVNVNVFNDFTVSIICLKMWHLALLFDCYVALCILFV